jgi:hypothetical protein
MKLTAEQKEKFLKRVDSGNPDRCWPWMGAINANGYGCVRISGRLERSHRVAWVVAGLEFNKELPLILHRCDNRRCCNPKHLFVGTHLINQRDAIAKGRARKAIGEDCGSAKLTREKAEEIRLLYESGKVTKKYLSDKFGVCQTTIGSIIAGTTWARKPSRPDEVSGMLVGLIPRRRKVA